MVDAGASRIVKAAVATTGNALQVNMHAPEKKLFPSGIYFVLGDWCVYSTALPVISFLYKVSFLVLPVVGDDEV